MKLITIFSLLILFSACAHNSGMPSNERIISSNNNVSKYTKLLDSAQAGKEYNNTIEDGKEVSLLVMEEYNSASGKTCKRFKINESLKLSCKNGNSQQWLEARAFR